MCVESHIGSGITGAGPIVRQGLEEIRGAQIIRVSFFDATAQEEGKNDRAVVCCEVLVDDKQGAETL